MYPAIARAAHISGSVVVRLVVSGDGIVTSATPVSGPPMLSPSAVDAAKNWTFHALQVGTQSTPFVADLKADFSVGHDVAFGQTKATVSMHP
jgi:protein TonB